MKRLLYITSIILLINAWKKNIEQSPVQNNPSDNATEVNGGGAFEWTSLPTPPHNSPTTPNRVISANDNVFCLDGVPYPTVHKLNNTTKQWSLFTDFDVSIPFSSYQFSYQSKVYWGFTAFSGGSYTNLSSIDVITGVKTNLASCPTSHFSGATVFVMGDKAYFLGGVNEDGLTINQEWEYNITTNQWTNMGNSPLGSRAGAVAFVVGTKVYLGLGYFKGSLNGGNPFYIYQDDWISYTPGSAYAAIKTPFPAQSRGWARGFLLDGQPYVGFGSNNSTLFTDLWRYNITGNSWTQQTSWPGTVSTNANNIGTFTLDNTGYIVKGDISQFWSYGN